MTVLNRNSQIGFDFITCHIRGRFTTTQPSNPRIESGYIPSTVQVGVDSMSTDFTFKKTAISFSPETMTTITTFAGVSGIDIDYSTSFEGSLVFQEHLEFSLVPDFKFPTPIYTLLDSIRKGFHSLIKNIRIWYFNFNRNSLLRWLL